MSVAAQNQGSIDLSDTDGLIERLRQTGRTDNIDVAAIAQEHGFDAGFVQDIVDAIRAERTIQPHAQIFWRHLLKTLGKSGSFFRRIWMEATDNPMLFVVLTGTVGYWGAVSLQAQQATSAGFLLVTTFVLHQLCYARFGMLRYPLYGAGAAALASLVANFGNRFQQGTGALVFSAVLTAMLYGFLGSIAALIGGAFGVSQRDRRMRSITRQEALDRLFVLRERLSKLGPGLKQAQSRNWFEATLYETNWPLVALLGGFALGAVRVLVIGGYRHVFPGPPQNDPVFATFQVFSAIVTGLSFLGIGFLTGRFGRAIVSQYIAFAGFWASSFIRLGDYGPQFAMNQLRGELLLPIAMLLFLSGILAGVGRVVENDSRRERRRAANEPAEIIAEIVQLERVLKADSSSRYVVSVDVAKSTAMKLNEDPLEVEWSFREYQKLVAECTLDQCGQVVSTSGDGAVLTFGSGRQALDASKDILTRLTWFNARVNRLRSPFRLRIGVHSDRVLGVLEDVQFTEVIDIAAHVQAHAPVGGILITECAAEALAEEPLTELKDPVEGRKVLLVVNPTLDA